MHTYTISDEGFAQSKKKMLTIGIPLLLVLAIVGISSSIANGGPDDINVLPFVIPVVAIAFFFNFRNIAKKQKATLESYRLIIGENGITRIQSNMTTAMIENDKIENIKRLNTGSLLVSGSGYSILVPKEIGNFHDAEARLLALKPISEAPKSKLMQLSPLMPFVAIVMMALVFVIENPIIVSVCGTAILILLGFFSVKLFTDKNIGSNTKRLLWFIPMVMFSIIMVMYLRWMGGV